MGKWKNGLPPVGEVCECTWGWKGLWVECIYHGKLRNGMPIIEEIGGGLIEFESALESVEFRPLKSKAELMRRKAVEEIADALLDAGAQDVPESIAEGMYDAGYRKVNELTDEQIRTVADAFNEGYDSIFESGATWARAQIMGEES